MSLFGARAPRCAAALLAVSTLACAPPRPTVKYSNVKGPLPDTAFDAYALQASLIRITATGSGSGDKLRASDFEIKSLPRESRTKLALHHADKPTLSTAVKVSKIPNTDLVSEIGVEVTDHRVEYINAAAGVVKTLLSIVPFKAAPAGGHKVKDLPFEIDLLTELAKPGVDQPGAFDVAFPGISVHVDALPADAQAFAALEIDGPSHQFIYAACRAATVSATLTNGNEKVDVIAHVKIADPNYVQTVGLPLKGKIKTHSECGVSVESEKAEIATDLAIVGALATQGKAIKDAIEAAKKPAAPDGQGAGK